MATKLGRPMFALMVVIGVLIWSAPSRAERRAVASDLVDGARCRVLAADQSPSVDGTYQVALCAQRAHDWAGALNALTRWLEHPGVPPDRRKVVRERVLAPLLDKAARLVVDPSPASVTIDGQEAQTASGVLYLAPGAHKIHVRSDHVAYESELTLRAGETKLIGLMPTAPAGDARSSEALPSDRGSMAVAGARMQPLSATAVGAAPDPRPSTPTKIVLALAIGAAVATGTWLLVSSRADQTRAARLRRRRI
jgi:hypothetical protein